MILTQDQQQRIRSRVSEIESKAFGEILVVVANRVTPVFWILWMLPAQTSWIALSGSLVFYPIENFWIHFMVFIGGALLGVVLSRLSWVQKVMLPNWVEQKFVQREALHYFLTSGVSRTPSRSGVLIFVSLFEHDIEVIVDSAVQEQVTNDEMNQIVSSALPHFKKKEYYEGIQSALNQVEKVLLQYFVKPEQKQNEYHEELLLVESSWD